MRIRLSAILVLTKILNAKAVRIIAQIGYGHGTCECWSVVSRDHLEISSTDFRYLGIPAVPRSFHSFSLELRSTRINALKATISQILLMFMNQTGLRIRNGCWLLMRHYELLHFC